MSGIAYWQVDAFAARPFSGNPAGVMVLERWPADTVMQKVASELGMPATAFLVSDSSGKADWDIRWFTPSAEIALCGHASLAAGHVLLSGRVGGQEADCARFRTRQSGVLEVRVSGSGYEIALPALQTAAAPYPEAAQYLGAEPLDTWRNQTRHNIFLFEDEAAIRGLEPDLAALASLGNDQFICTARGDHSDIVSRVFVPGGGVGEDSVTGSAHAALAPFWAQRLGRNTMTAHQASTRGGDLTLRVESERVWLGGACVSVAEGRWMVPMR